MKHDHIPRAIARPAHPEAAQLDGVASGAARQQRPASPTALPANEQHSEVIVVPMMQRAATRPNPTTPRLPVSGQSGDVHVAPNLHALVTATALADMPQTAAEQERRDLNAIVHRVLMIGLMISTTLMLIGVGLDLFSQRDLPTAVPEVGDVIQRVLVLRPSGFLSLGLLVLVATPIVRVLGSIGAFLYERDWRFVGITTLVLVILLTSLLLGKG
jgi:uncharacterized membrane protein